MIFLDNQFKNKKKQKLQCIKVHRSKLIYYIMNNLIGLQR